MLEVVAEKQPIGPLGFLLRATARPIAAVSETGVGIEILASTGDRLRLDREAAVVPHIDQNTARGTAAWLDTELVLEPSGVDLWLVVLPGYSTRSSSPASPFPGLR